MKKRAALLFVLLLVVYNANLRSILSGDTEPAKVLPLALLQDKSFYLDRFAARFCGHEWPLAPYFLWPSGEHQVSAYPVITPLLATPFFLPLLGEPTPSMLQLDAAAKLAASVVTALSGVAVYLTLAALGARHPCALTLLYGLGSEAWVISSQALWQHGASQLFLTLTVLALLQGRFTLAGLACSLSVANRLPNLVFAVIMAVYAGRQKGWRFFLFPPLVAALLVGYNQAWCGHPFGPQGATGQWTSAWPLGMAGLLLGPSHGLILFCPWVLLSFYGMYRLWRGSGSALLRCVSLAIVGELLLYSCWTYWWGGACFGPRLASDLFPLLIFMLVPLGARAAPLLVATGLYSVAVQALGAFCWFPPRGLPHEQWRWRDGQLAQTWRARRVQAPVFGAEFFPSEPEKPLASFGQELTAEHPPRQLQPGEGLEMRIRALNPGPETWPARTVRASYRWLDPERRMVVPDGLRTPLEEDLPPGSRTELDLRLLAPSRPGSYRLRLTMMQEQVDCFDARGGAAPEFPVEVGPGRLLAQAQRVRGFSAEEKDGLTRFAWSVEKNVELSFESPHSGAAELVLRGMGAPELGRTEVDVALNGSACGRLYFGAEWTTVHLPVEAVRAGPNKVTLSFPRQRTPSLRESRRLALALASLQVLGPAP